MSDNLVSRLRDIAPEHDDMPITRRAMLEAATALEEARAEIERRDAAHARMRDRAHAAESELSTLRARVREIVGPFTRYRVRMISSDSVADYSVHVESSTENQPKFKHYAAARQLNEDLE